jgi:hypothetical protein
MVFFQPVPHCFQGYYAGRRNNAGLPHGSTQYFAKLADPANELRISNH